MPLSLRRSARKKIPAFTRRAIREKMNGTGQRNIQAADNAAARQRFCVPHAAKSKPAAGIIGSGLSTHATLALAGVRNQVLTVR